MPNFHRLTVPSYFGGLPSGFDYINNATSGTPAIANGVLSYGPNIGSYFVGFGDDGTSGDANRPAQALAQNTDYLDNVLHDDLVQLIRSGDTTVSGSPQTSITLSGAGTIWLGSGGYALQDLFHIVDSTERDIEVSGTKVVVASIASGGSVGGGFASGSVTLTLNVGIPVGVTWRIYSCQRTNLTSLPIDALTLPFMRNADSVDGSVVDLVAQISNPHTLGSSVAGLQAYRFQGPDGTRLAKNATLFFDADPADSGATVRQFKWTTREQSTNRQVAALYDDPTSTLFTGLTGILQMDTGIGFSSLGTFFFQDANLSSAGASLNKTWGLTSTNASYGDQFPRIFDVPVTFNMIGAQAPSLLNYVNGRWETTCGDGTVSFGDFTGPQSVHAAITYAASVGVGVTNLNIKLKAGTYNFTSFVSLPANCDVVIEGVSPTQTILQGNVAGFTQNALFNLSSGRLWLKNMTMQWASGQQFAVIGSAGTSLFMDTVVVNNLGIIMTNPGTYQKVAAIFCRNCNFVPSTAGVVQWLLTFNDNDAASHNGLYFEDCAWQCSDETVPMRIVGGTTGGRTNIERLRFQGCKYVLGGTATASGHLTHNTGVLEINPNGGNGLLCLHDISWVDCFPVSSTTAANAPLARIYSVALGDNTGTNTAIIERVEIRGGRWECNQGAATAISPVLISAQETVIEDVIFIGCAFGSGGQSSEDVNLIDGVTYSIADWAQFIFAPGAQTVSQISKDIRLSIRNTSFKQFQQYSNSGDVWLILGAGTWIDGMMVTDYATGGGGALPNARVKVQCGIAPNYGAGGGSIKHLTMYGAAAGSSAGWTSQTTGSSALLMVLPNAYNVTSEFDPLVFERLILAGFTGAGSNNDDGVVLRNLTGDTTVGWGYSFVDCTVTGNFHNLIMYGYASSGSGNNGQMLKGFSIIRGVYSFAQQTGIVLNPDYVGDVLIDGVRAKNNAHMGLTVSPKNWGASSRSVTFTCVNSKFHDNLSGAGQCQFLANSGVPYIVFLGNSCMLNGALDSAQFQQAGNTTINSTEDLGNAFWIYGVNTGIFGSSTNTMTYLSASGMVNNVAKLLTP
jgi:hypothetical protein